MILCFIMNWALIAEAMSHLRDRASLEISRPSGDITDGVRFTRDYHPGNFHSWVFSTLRRFPPPTVYLSYFIQAPPMGFKEQFVAFALNLLRVFPKRFIQKTILFWVRESPSTQRTEILCYGFTPDPYSTFLQQTEFNLSGNRRRVTHLAYRKQLTWEEGTSTTKSV